MTAPFAPPPPRLVWVMVIATLLMALAIPFARRDDWAGYLALSTISGAAILLWTAFLFGLARNVAGWYRDKPGPTDTVEARGCYKGHIYELAWDSERFYLQTFNGHRVIDLPLDSILDVIDADALFVEGEVTVNTSRKYVPFPNSRRERAKILSLINERARLSSRFRHEIEIRRNRFLRRGSIWLPISLTVAAALLLPILYFPDPKELNLLLAIAGMAYGLGWYWLIWRFAHSIAWVLAARKLQSILAAARSTDRHDVA